MVDPIALWRRKRQPEQRESAAMVGRWLLPAQGRGSRRCSRPAGEQEPSDFQEFAGAVAGGVVEGEEHTQAAAVGGEGEFGTVIFLA